MGEEEESPLIDSVLCAFHSAKRSPGIQSAQAPWKEEFLLCQLYATSITTTIPPLSYQPYHFLNSFSWDDDDNYPQRLGGVSEWGPNSFPSVHQVTKSEPGALYVVILFPLQQE